MIAALYVVCALLLLVWSALCAFLASRSVVNPYTLVLVWLCPLFWAWITLADGLAGQ